MAMRTRLLLIFSMLLPLLAWGNTYPLIEMLGAPGSAGLGVVLRSERSPYEGAGTRNDFVPVYLYEGKQVFLRASRAGVKLVDDRAHGLEAILDYRFEGFPYDRKPQSLAGMETREPTLDLGLAYHYRTALGTLNAEYLRDANSIHKGSEIRLRYNYDWHAGRLHLRPSLTLAARSAKLNNYYYGVRAEEATAARPAYDPGAGIDRWIGLYGFYEITEWWRLLGGISVDLMDRKVRNSPIVRDGSRPTVFLGVAYDFGGTRAKAPPTEASPPRYLKVLYGKSTDCNLVTTMSLRCTSTSTTDRTRVAAIEYGRPFIERLHDWPLDFVGYVGLLRHAENGLQPDSWQLNAYLKGFYYGFPWSERVKTRIGFGVGLSLAARIPYVEGRDQAARGRNTSKLLNYLDPSIDISVGDLIGARSLRETYAGFGVSHRSGIFGRSQMLGNVNGGSNYIYTYIESKF
jgi:outer membrane protein